MPKVLRLPLLASAALVALAFAGPALAAYTPKLVVGGGGTQTTMRVTWPDADDPTAAVVLYAPTAYQLGASAVGAQIGTANAVLIAKELGNTKVTLSGQVNVADPTTTAIRTAATQCTRNPVHEQVWLLTLSVGGSGQNPIQLPAFVDRTTAAETTLGGVKIQFCFRSPDIPPAQGGQPLGGKPVDALISLTAGLTAPATAGDYLWRGLFTPYTPGTASANAVGTKEAQSILRVPRAVVLKAKRIARTRKVRGKRRTIYVVQLTGQVTEGGTRLGGVTVQIFRNGRRIRTVKTNEDAGFTVTFLLPSTATFRIRAAVAERSTSCQQTTVAPAGCTSATVTAWIAQSGPLRVVRPKPRR